jgi:hypothetical protein
VDKFSLGFEYTQDMYDQLVAEMDAKLKYSESDIALKAVLEAYKPYMGTRMPSAEALFQLYTGDWDALGDQINTARRAAGYRANVKTEPGWGTINSSYVQTIIGLARIADPRMYDSFYVPNRDSVASDWAATKVSPYKNSYYGFKKYIPYNAPASWSDEKLPYAEGFNSINQRIFRVSDVYLQYAEACFETGDMGNAKKYLNKVRRRGWKLPFDDASLQTPNAIDYDGSTDFKTELIAEREKELCLEGHLWFDYLRWNKTAELFSSRGFNPDKHHRLPIPLSERQIVGMNILLQNKGY